jgi:hypothetical protein
MTSTPDVNFGIYFPCSECGIRFNAWQNFVVHMIVDHEWERELADARWKQMVDARALTPRPVYQAA